MSKDAEYEGKVTSWWDSLTEEQQEMAFCAVVGKIFDGDIMQGGSYRYVLYDVFKFKPHMYSVAMDYGYLMIHNRLQQDDDVY